jgi:adenosylcobinamide kinase/adenosylcobinamide-phosphate guanylyltransferase
VPCRLGSVLDGLTGAPAVRVALVDCLTLLVSNVLLAQPEAADPWPAVEAEVNALIQFAARSAVATVVVSNEVGLGIVPEHRLARVYRDLLGRANQRLAAAATEVYFVVAGIPLEIKGLGRPVTAHTGGRE